MKRVFKKFIGVFCFIFLFFNAASQEAFVASGGEATGSGGSASYSVGQLVYMTFLGSNGIITQGVQQPYEISVAHSIEEAEGISLVFSAYPNPTKDYLNLKIDNYNSEFLWYHIYDFSGKLLEKKQIFDDETSIFMGSFTSAVYFIRIIDNTRELKTFKIIKN